MSNCINRRGTACSFPLASLSREGDHLWWKEFYLQQTLFRRGRRLRRPAFCRCHSELVELLPCKSTCSQVESQRHNYTTVGATIGRPTITTKFYQYFIAACKFSFCCQHLYKKRNNHHEASTIPTKQPQMDVFSHRLLTCRHTVNSHRNATQFANLLPRLATNPNVAPNLRLCKIFPQSGVFVQANQRWHTPPKDVVFSLCKQAVQCRKGA